MEIVLKYIAMCKVLMKQSDDIERKCPVVLRLNGYLMKNFIWNSWNDPCCIVLSSLKIDQNSNLCFLSSSEDLNVPIDHEAISSTAETVNPVTKNLHNCYHNNEQLDTFTVDQLLSKLNVESTFIFSCLSPIDRIDLPYFARYLNPALIEKKSLLSSLFVTDITFKDTLLMWKRNKLLT